ncbi:hypothetical protein HPB47_022389 [Ixodes persulcatus]|uniref:Uncharacterized protein n=1 Tax=Ixodes persulcatus TaxID=34615 RepID=A0AC60QD72_IXOPE|nr:hypothetical protein HPB47_022389 [Ixodes persulcatus]
MTDNQTPASTPTPVAAVAVRLPPYWDRNPRVWFLQAESQFHLTHITSQQRMYHHVVSVLSPTAADEVYDVLCNPSTTNPYDQLKAALLQRTEASERTRWQQLLSAEELGDRRPSQLLRRMTQLLGERASTIDDALLRELFLQRLPPNVQMVLAAAAPLNLTGLAGLADALSSHDGLISSTELLSNHIYSKPAVVYLPPENGKSLRHQHHGSSHLPVSIIEGYPSSNVSYVYSRPKKKHWSQQDSPYAERKLHKLNSRRYSDEMKQGDMVSRESGLDFAVEAYELSEAECDMPSRHFPVQR